MRHLRHVAALTVSTLLLVGCGNGGDSDGDADASGCKDAVAEAAEAANLDDEGNLDAAFEACGDLAEFGAAIQESPEVLEGVGSDIEGWVQERCRESEALNDTALCEAAR